MSRQWESEEWPDIIGGESREYEKSDRNFEGVLEVRKTLPCPMCRVSVLAGGARQGDSVTYLAFIEAMLEWLNGKRVRITFEWD